jgi:hypothetical protein
MNCESTGLSHLQVDQWICLYLQKASTESLIGFYTRKKHHNFFYMFVDAGQFSSNKYKRWRLWMRNEIMSDMLRSNKVTMSPCVTGQSQCDIFLHLMFTSFRQGEKYLPTLILESLNRWCSMEVETCTWGQVLALQILWVIVLCKSSCFRLLVDSLMSPPQVGGL